MFLCFTSFVQKLFNIISAGLKTAFPKNNFNISAVYTNWAFLDNNLTEIFRRFEGSSCCADKSRLILKEYINYKKTDEMPVFNKEKYWTPEKGEAKLWMSIVDGMIELIYGKNAKYIISLKNIVKMYNPDK